MILLIALASAFFTAIIGVHAIFGGFMVGLIVPREKSFAIKVTEKLEDLIGALFLPLYFTLSGLRTDLGLLNDGITWAYVVAVTLTAFFSKVIGATLAAKLSGLVWRESLTVGSLMSCKGLVELIVLNIGLQAKILSTRTFTIFVVMALVTTFATTPLVTFLYPPWYQKKLAAWKRGEIDWDTGKPPGASDAVNQNDLPNSSDRIGQLLVYLRLDNMPGLLGLVSLFGKDPTSGPVSDEKGVVVEETRPTRSVRAHGLRLVELGDRFSSVMTVAEVEDYSKNDPVVNTWKTVGQILKVAVSGEVAIMTQSRFSEALLTKSSDISSDLMLLPWSGTGTVGDTLHHLDESQASPSYISFAKSVLGSAKSGVGIFYTGGGSAAHDIGAQEPERLKLTRAYSFSDIHQEIRPLPVKTKAQRIIFPYFGGNDDRFALKLVLQLCERSEVTATIFHPITDSAGAGGASSSTASPANDREYLNAVAAALDAAVSSRIEFKFPTNNDPAEELVGSTKLALAEDSGDVSWNNLVVLGRRGSAGKISRGCKAAHGISDEFVECLGESAAVVIGSKLKADLLIVQANPSKA